MTDQGKTADAIRRHVSSNATRYFKETLRSSTPFSVNVTAYNAKPNCFDVEIRLSHDNSKLLFAKICPKYAHVNEAEVEYSNLQLYYLIYKRSKLGVRVPQPFGIVTEINAVLMERVLGDEFREVIKKELTLRVSPEGKARILRIIENAALWLKIYHSVRLSRAKACCSKAFYKYADHFLANLSSRRFLCDQLTSYRNVLDWFYREQFPYMMDISNVHGDFGMSNILVRGEDITVVDLGSSMRESIFFDISFFLVCLETIYYKLGFLLRERRFVAKMQCSFLKSYFGESITLSSFHHFLVDFYSVAHSLNICNYQLHEVSKLPRVVRMCGVGAVEVLYRRRLAIRLKSMEKYLKSVHYYREDC